MNIGDKMFAYIASSRNGGLTNGMVNEYNNSLILLGDEKQIFVPKLNAYVGLGQTAYEYILSRIEDNNNNIGDLNEFIHRDVVTSIYVSYLPKEIQTIVGNDSSKKLTVGTQNSSGNYAHDITGGNETDKTYWTRANRDIVIKGVDDYNHSTYRGTSGININIKHNNPATLNTGTINNMTYAYWSPYDQIIIDDSNTWSYITASNTYMFNFAMNFASQQANRVYKNILGINDNVYIEKEFDEAFHYIDEENILETIQDVYVRTNINTPSDQGNIPFDSNNNYSYGYNYKKVTVINSDGYYDIYIDYGESTQKLIWTNNPSKTPDLSVLATEENGGIESVVINNGSVTRPVWYQIDTEHTANNINIVDGIQTIQEVAYILDVITDNKGGSYDGINLAYNIAYNYVEIMELKKWRDNIGNEAVKSFEARSQSPDLLTVNYYSGDLWNHDNPATSHVKLDVDLKLAQTYILGGSTYAAYLNGTSGGNLPSANKTYYLVNNDTTSVSNYIKLPITDDTMRTNIWNKIQNNDELKKLYHPVNSSDLEQGFEQNSGEFLTSKNDLGNITNKYIYFPYTIGQYNETIGLTDVKWVTTYVGWGNYELISYAQTAYNSVWQHIHDEINKLDYADTPLGQNGLGKTCTYNGDDGLFVTRVQETDGIISVIHKKLPLDTILSNSLYYSNDMFIPVSGQEARSKQLVYQLVNGEYVQINVPNNIPPEEYNTFSYYIKTNLSDFAAVAADVSIDKLIENEGQTSYFKKVTSTNFTQYIPIDLQSTYATSGNGLFNTNGKTIANKIYYWKKTGTQIKYFDTRSVQLTDGSTKLLFNSYITYLSTASETNSGFADAWDVRRTIENMFKWVDLKTNKVI